MTIEEIIKRQKEHLTKAQIGELIQATERYKQLNASNRASAMRTLSDQYRATRRGLQNTGLAGRKGKLISGQEKAARIRANEAYRSYNAGLRQIDNAYAQNRAARMANETARANQLAETERIQAENDKEAARINAEYEAWLRKKKAAEAEYKRRLEEIERLRAQQQAQQQQIRERIEEDRTEQSGVVQGSRIQRLAKDKHPQLETSDYARAAQEQAVQRAVNEYQQTQKVFRQQREADAMYDAMHPGSAITRAPHTDDYVMEQKRVENARQLKGSGASDAEVWFADAYGVSPNRYKTVKNENPELIKELTGAIQSIRANSDTWDAILNGEDESHQVKGIGTVRTKAYTAAEKNKARTEKASAYRTLAIADAAMRIENESVRKLFVIDDAAFDVMYAAALQIYKIRVNQAENLPFDNDRVTGESTTATYNRLMAEAAEAFAPYEAAKRLKDESQEEAFIAGTYGVDETLTPKRPDWLKGSIYSDGHENWVEAHNRGWSADDYEKNADHRVGNYEALVNEWSFINGRTALLYTQNFQVTNDIANIGEWVGHAFGGDINRNEAYRSFRRKCESKMGVSSEKMDSLLTLSNLMTDEERAKYNTILRDGGAEEADKYFEYLYESVLPNRFEQFVENEIASQTNTPEERLLQSIVSIPNNLIQGVSGTIHTMTTNVDDPVAARLDAKKYTTAQAMRGAVGSHYGEVGNFLYQGVMSMADSTTVALVGQGIGGILKGAGVASGLATKAGSVLGGSLLGATAYTSAYEESIQRGLSPEKAKQTALANGINEMLFEAVSLDILVGHFQKGGILKVSKNGFVNWVVNTLVQGGVEGSEEVFTDIANRLWDNRINGVFSEELTAVRKYMMEDGLTYKQALQKVNDEFGAQLWESFKAGALSGGVMGGGATFIGMVQNRTNESLGKGLRQNDRVMNELRNFDYKSEYAQEILTQDKLTNQDVADLFNIRQMELLEQYKGDIQQAVRDGKITQEDANLLQKFQENNVQVTQDGKVIRNENGVTAEEYAHLMDEVIPQIDTEHKIQFLDNAEIAELTQAVGGKVAAAFENSETAKADANRTYRETVDAIREDESMTDEQKQAKIAEAKQTRDAAIESAKTKVDEALNVKGTELKIEGNTVNVGKGSGKVTFDFSTKEKSNWTINDMTREQRSALTFAKMVAEKYGVNIKVEQESIGSQNGEYDPKTNTITVSLSGSNSVIYTMSHELTHWLKAQNEQGYNDLRDMINEQLSREDLSSSVLPDMYNLAQSEDEGLHNAVAEKGNLWDGLKEYERKRYAEHDIILDDAAVEEEVVARCCESFLGSGSFVRDMAQKHFRTARNIAKYMMTMQQNIAELQESAKDRAYFADESPEDTLLRQYAEINRIARLWTKAVNDAIESDPKARKEAEAIELSDVETKYSIRQEAPPTKTGYAYKVFMVKDGHLYPPMVANPGGKGTPVGVWLNADAAPLAGYSAEGRPQVAAGGKGTSTGRGKLAYRPGWHLGDLPKATQFNKSDKNHRVQAIDKDGNPKFNKKGKPVWARTHFPANFVWALCEYAMDVDYQEEAMSYGYTKNGKFRHSYAGLPRLPENGYYHYRTNPDPNTVPWVITGAMRVARIMTDEEVNSILEQNGVEPVPRLGGEIDLAKFGLKAGDVVKGETKASISVTDQQYLDLARRYESGDKSVEAELRKQVDAAAKRAGYNEHGFHRTSANFYIFDRAKQGTRFGGYSRLGKGFYFAHEYFDTQQYSDGSRVIEAYLSMKKPYDGRKPMTEDIKAKVDEYYKNKEQNGYDPTYPISKEQFLKNLEWEKAVDIGTPSLFLDHFKYDKNGKMTDGVRDFLESMGYDGIITDNEMVVFDPSQIKSADLITKDDSGNIIPLSERFKTDRTGEDAWKNEDIRYSIGVNDEVITNKSGDPVMKVTDNGNSSMYSLSTFDNDGRQMLDEYLQKRVAEGKLDKEDAKTIKDKMEEIYNICMEYKGKYVAFGAWSDADVDMDDQGHPVFSVIRNNAEYPMNLDFSLVCVKRRALNAVLNQIIKMGQMENLILDDRALVKVNEMIRSKGFETACDLCFVEAKRFRQAGVADTFVELYNGMVKTLKKGNLSYFNFGGNESIEQSEGIINVPDSELNWTRIDALIDKYNKKVENGGGKAMDVPTAIAFELKNHPESRQLLLRGDFMSTNGFDAVAKNAPRILKLYNKKKGTGGPKASFGDMQYLNDIETKGWTPEDAYAVGGVRVQSFSDFVPRMFFDYCQMVADLSAAKLPAHAYTKEESFVKLFGLTGMKINMSLIPKVAGDGLPAGLMYQRDQKGNVVYKDGRPVITYAWAGESFDYEKAKEIQADAEYGKNCGTICVGVSDEHIRMLMDDPTIRMIIPYHKSSLNKVVAQMQHIDAYENYEKMQTTKDRNGNKLKVDFGFNQALHEMGDPQAVARAYLDWCEENGYTPKFKKFAYNADGSMNENYYKLLEDFALYDEQGNYCEQKAVEMKFPTDESAFGSVDYLLAHEPGMPSKFEKDGKKDQFKGFLIQDSDRQELLDMRAKPIAEEIIRESAKWRVERQVEAAQEAAKKAKKSKKKASLSVEGESLGKDYLKYLHLGTKVVNQTATEDEIRDFKRRMNALSQDNREAFLDKLREKLIRDDEGAKVREVRDRQIARLKQEFRESREKMKEARIRRDIITVLKNGNDRIVKMLANPTENSHVPVQLAQTVSEYAIALNDILTKSEPRTGENAGKEKQTQKGRLNFNKLIRVYNQTFADQDTIEQAARENPGFDPRGKYLDVTQKDESLVQMLNDMNEIVQDKRLSDLDSYELQMLLSTMRGVIHTVQEANKQIVRGEHIETYKRGDRMTEQIESAPKVWGRAYLNETLDLRRLALIYSGSDENAEFVQLVKELNEGAKERARVDQVLTGMFTDLTTKYGKELRGWYGKDAEWIDTGIVRNGKKIEITKGMRVSLAMHVQNSGNMRHITNGGVTIPNRELYRKGKLKDAYAHGNTVALSESEVNEIISHMTEAERAYVEVANEFFHKRAGYYINRTSLQLLGYAKAIVENYFPIHSDANYLQTNWGDIMRSGSVEGWGSLKERREASNAIYLEDITSVVNRQIRGVALYAGLAIPVRNWRAVLNSTVWAENEDGVWLPRTTVQKALTQRMGSHGMDVLEGFLTDVQETSAVQSTGFDKWLAKVQTNYVKSVLLGNAKVALKQLASIPTANYIIPWKYLLKGMFSGKADTDIMSDYTSLWKLRESNNATEITSIMREQGLEAKMPWLLGWITGMDKWATKRLWKACELMVADEGKYPIGSDAYYKAVGNLWDDVIQQTQPNFTPLQRADMLRGTSLGKGKEIAHSLTLFGTQRMQNGGILIESLFELKNSKGKSVEAQKKARVKFAKAVTSQIVQNVMLVAIGFIVDALRGRMKAWQDDKDKEVTLKSVAKYAGDQFIGNALGSFLGGSEVKDALTVFVKRMVLDEDAYDVELTVPTVETLETMFAFFTSDLPKYIKYMTNDKYTAEEKMRKSHKFTIVLARAAGYATGLPFENAVKDMFNGINPALQDLIDWAKTGELNLWLHQSGKLDKAKTAANYKEWTKAGFSGRDYFYYEKMMSDVKGGREGRIPVLLQSDLTNEQKAMLMRMFDTSGATSDGTKVYAKNGDLVIDFAAPTEKQQALPMQTAETEETAAPTTTPTATPKPTENPLTDARQEGVREAVAKGVPEQTAFDAFLAYQNMGKSKSDDYSRNDDFRAWLFKNVQKPEERAILEYQVIGQASKVEGAVTYRDSGVVYRDYTNESWFKLSEHNLSKDGTNKRYEAGKRLEKTGLSVEKTVAIYDGLKDLTKKSEWTEYLKKQGLTDEQIKIFLWSRGWAK